MSDSPIKSKLVEPGRQNLQTVEKQDLDPGRPYEVFKVWKTIQGEGPFAGRPAVFVRLAGCNLQCPACDTDYTSRRDLMSTHTLFAEVVKLATRGLVVFTGGEPFRQRLGPIVRELIHTGDYSVQIETNGTLWDEDMPWFGDLTVVCSPKTPKIHPLTEERVNYYKYVVEDGHIDPVDGLPTRVLGAPCAAHKPRPHFPRHKVYIQPMDNGPWLGGMTGNNVHAAAEVCMRHGYTLSLQIHKILGLE